MTNLSSLIQAKDHQSIIQFFESCKDDSFSPDQIFSIAYSYYCLSKYHIAAELCSSISSVFHSSVSFICLYGSALRLSGEPHEALAIFVDAIDQGVKSSQLLNNYSNVLVDLGRLEEAKLILDDLVNKEPEYEDAVSNLVRVVSLISDTPLVSSTINLPIDPLVAAFSTSEIKHYRPVTSQETDSSKFNPPFDSFPERRESMEVMELLSLSRQLCLSKPKIAIKYLNQVYSSCSTIRAELYEIASIAYVNLKLFSDAEVSLLTALNLGLNSVDVYLNLANLCAMRGDCKLSLHWLYIADSRFPGNVMVDKVRATLSKNTSDVSALPPFQINMEQASPGSFTQNS